jgi:arylsulfatase A-like enzyme
MENPTTTNSTNQPINNTDTIVNKPNIILITVDQLRYPMHFLSLQEKYGIDSAGTFLKQFMPNLFYYFWDPGVKFSNYYTAASDCTAARATIHTGLYAYQTYSMLTLTTYPPEVPKQPVLDTRFPTIGNLMRDAGYLTPYFGKWHLSYDVSDLEDYGYTSNTPNQDFPGFAGEGQATDDTPAWQAAHWINEYVAKAKAKQNTDPGSTPPPFFLTLNFVNPHDKQWFWGGIQADDFYAVYNAVKQAFPGETPPGPYVRIPKEDNPPLVYKPDIDNAIRNFQTQTQLNSKPKTQTLVKEVFQYQMGGIFESDQKGPQQYVSVNFPVGFYYANAPTHPGDHKAIAPETYWSRALDSYVQLMTMVDESIGNFMKSIPEEVRQNAVFIFTSDHGEYGSSHGLQGKGGTVYEEGIQVPLIVRDSRSNGYAKDTGSVRNQLTSSVDLLPMIVSMGNGGTTGWMTGNKYEQLYGNGKRCDLLSILDRANANGRTYALHSTDEFVPYPYNYNQSPLHVIGLIQTNLQGGNKTKLGVYTTWAPYSTGQTKATVINPLSRNPPQYQNMEFYNHSQEQGALENTSADISTSTQAQAANSLLFGTLLSTELQATLPDEYIPAQIAAYTHLNEYMELVACMADPASCSATASAQTAAASGDVERVVVRAWAL